MHATFFINSGPILAGDPDHMTVAAADSSSPRSATRSAGTRSTTPTSSRCRRRRRCTRSATIAPRSSGWGFTVTSFAYPFGSWDANAEEIVQGCGYDSARTVSGVSIHVAKGKIGETIPPADPFATRTPPNPKKATKLTTMEQYVTNAEEGVAASGQSLWIQFVFHRYCDAHCGAYTIQPAKFKALLDFLQVEEGKNLVTVLTTAQAMALG